VGNLINKLIERHLEIFNFKKSKKSLKNNLPIKVFWLLRGSHNTASSRLQGYLIHQELRKHHTSFIDSKLILDPPFWIDTVPWTAEMYDEFVEISKGQIVILQKMFGEKFINLVKKIRSKGGVVIFVHCDLDEENKVPFFCNTLIVPSKKLAEWYRIKGLNDIRIINDPIEHSWQKPLKVKNSSKSLTIGWIGHSNNWLSLDEIQSVLEEEDFFDFKLITISNHIDADVKWSLENVKKTIVDFDIAVVPIIKSNDVNVKSSNRITMFMSAGIPVIAGDLYAYREVIQNGINGFVFNSRDELKEQLTILRDPKIRSNIGVKGFSTVQKSYSLTKITEKWVEVIMSNNNNFICNSSSQLIHDFKFKSNLKFYDLVKNNSKESFLLLKKLKKQFILNPTFSKLKAIIKYYLK